MDDLKRKSIRALIIYYGNQSALHIAVNQVFHERMKHLEIDCHTVREKQSKEIVKLLPIKYKDQPIDFFTKGLHLQ